MDPQSARTLALSKPQLQPRSRGDRDLQGSRSRWHEWHVPTTWVRTHCRQVGPWQQPPAGHSLCVTIPSPSSIPARRFSLVLLTVRLPLRAGRSARHISSAGTLLEEMSYSPRGNVLLPFALPSPTCLPELPSPLAAEEGQRQGGFWSSSLSPPSSLTETAGPQLQLGIPLSGKKNPFLIAGTQISPRGGWVMETKCRCSDMSPHQKK